MANSTFGDENAHAPSISNDLDIEDEPTRHEAPVAAVKAGPRRGACVLVAFLMVAIVFVAAANFDRWPRRNGKMKSVRIKLPGSPYGNEWHDIPCGELTCKWQGAFGDKRVYTTAIAPDLPPPKNRIFISKEGAVYYPDVAIDVARKKENVAGVATYEFASDMFMGYFRLPSPKGRLIGRTPSVDFSSAAKKLLWVAGNCHSKNNREDLARELQHAGLLDSVGQCLRNKVVDEKWQESGGRVNKHALMKQYLFYAAFENQHSVDYVTEKFFDALASGTVPVVYGVPNHNDIIPRSWAIWEDEFESRTELIDYIRKVANNETLYNEYQEARREVNWPQWFVKRWTFPRSRECRMCQWVAAQR